MSELQNDAPEDDKPEFNEAEFKKDLTELIPLLSYVINFIPLSGAHGVQRHSNLRWPSKPLSQILTPNNPCT